MKATSTGQQQSVEGSLPAQAEAAGAAPGRSYEELERQLARCQEDLSRLETFLDALLSNDPDTIYYKDRESRFVRVSKSKVERTLQIVRDNYRVAHPNAGPDEWPPHLVGPEPFAEWLIGKTDFDTYPEAFARLAYADEQEIIRTGKPMDGKLEKATLADGKIAWRLVTKMPWRDKTGNIIGTFGVSKDVTGIKEAEEALARERSLLRTLIDNIPDGIYTKDTAGRKTMANPADLKTLRCKTEAEAIGKNDFDLFPKHIAEKFWADDQKVLQGQPVINREEYFLDEEGHKRWLLTSKLPLRDQSGAIVGLVGIGREITQQKQVEEALRQSHDQLEKRVAERTAELTRERLLLKTLIDNLPDLIYAKDTTGRKTITNPADLRVMGCASEAEAIGKSDFDFFPKEIAEKFWADDQQVLQGQPVINREEYYLDEAGGKHWLLTSKLPLRSRSGKVIGLVGIGRDITTIKETDAKLEQAHKQLLETSRQAGMAEVATSVLHNVGNVLNSVNVASACVADSLRQSRVGNLSKVVALLREHGAELGHFMTDDPKGKQLPGYLAQLADHLAGEQTDALEKLARLQKNVEHIREIIAMQQNYAKVSGMLELLPIADLVEDAIRMNTGSMERHNIQVLREYAETPPVLVDKHKVLQILVNLIRNAKYACDESKKPDKRIIMRLANGDNRVKVSFIDNGIGIPAENLTRIFNYGFTTRKDGHGFGLHNAALAAKEMGGSLAAFSEGPGRGATFTLELPVREQKAKL